MSDPTPVVLHPGSHRSLPYYMSSGNIVSGVRLIGLSGLSVI